MGIAVSATAAMPVFAQSEELWELYGQINLGVMSVDDGSARDDFFGENSNIPSRLGFWYRAPGDTGARLSYNAEIGLGMTGSGALSKSNVGFRIDIQRTSVRKLEAILTSELLGTLSLGQGSMASDNASGVDLSGTSVVQQVAVEDVGGGTEILRADGSASGILIGDVFNAFDGPRRFRLRYDSAEFAGFKVSAAFGEEVLDQQNDETYRDLAIRYLAAPGAYEVEYAASHEWAGDDNEVSLLSGSALHTPSGLSATYATGRQSKGGARYNYIKVGLEREVWAAGPTSFSVDYLDGRNYAFSGSDTHAIGVAVVQTITSLNLQVFAAYRTFELQSPSESYRDVDATIIGARWTF